MKTLIRLGLLSTVSLLGAVLLFSAQPAFAQCSASFPVAPEDETTPSLGKFTIWIHPDFQPLFSGYDPTYWNDTEKRLTSPTVEDPATEIKVSAPHAHGSATDGSGTLVGATNQITVDDGMIGPGPAGMQGGSPAPQEVHTEVYKFLLDHPASGMQLRAGRFFDPSLVSFGEVESKDGDSYPELEGESYFNVMVEADFPLAGDLATVYNSTPLLVVAPDSVCWMPPTVVYIHQNTSAVPVYFKFDHTDGTTWNANDLLGFLVISGHGVGSVPWGVFENTYDSLEAEGGMPVPDQIPTLTEWGIIIFCFLLIGWMAWMFVRRRKSVTIGV